MKKRLYTDSVRIREVCLWLKADCARVYRLSLWSGCREHNGFHRKWFRIDLAVLYYPEVSKALIGGQIPAGVARVAAYGKPRYRRQECYENILIKIGWYRGSLCSRPFFADGGFLFFPHKILLLVSMHVGILPMSFYKEIRVKLNHF